MSASRPSRRALVESSTLGAGALLALVLLGIVNYFGWKYYHRFDWTETRLYSLSEKSRNVLAALDRDVEAVVFLSPGDPLFDPVRELLGRYAAESPRFTVRIVDPDKNPAEMRSLVERYELNQVPALVFDAGDDRRQVESNDLAEYDYSGMQFGQGPTMTGFKGEQAFTGAVLELAESRKPKILFTSGHGELKTDDYSPSGLSQAQDLLGRDNFDVEEWASLGQPAVPEGTDLVVIAGPTSGFAEPEVEVLRAYLAGGGRLFVLLDPTLAGDGGLQPLGLEELLAEHGVEIGRNIVVDPANPLPFYGAETIFVGDYGTHGITRSLSQAQVPVIFPLARSVARRDDVEGWKIDVLLRTSADGWGEVDLANLRGVEKGDDDLAGPVPLGLAVEAEGGEGGEQAADDDVTSDPAAAELAAAADDGEAPGARLVVLGDSDFATNGQLANVGNAELLANCMNWLVERENLVGIPPKAPEQVRLSLSAGQLRRLSWLVLGLLPGLAIVSGVAMHFRRRR